jgi:hypothetical protein
MHNWKIIAIYTIIAPILRAIFTSISMLFKFNKNDHPLIVASVVLSSFPQTLLVSFFACLLSAIGAGIAHIFLIQRVTPVFFVIGVSLTALIFQLVFQLAIMLISPFESIQLFFWFALPPIFGSVATSAFFAWRTKA